MMLRAALMLGLLPGAALATPPLPPECVGVETPPSAAVAPCQELYVRSASHEVNPAFAACISDALYPLLDTEEARNWQADLADDPCAVWANAWEAWLIMTAVAVSAIPDDRHDEIVEQASRALGLMEGNIRMYPIEMLFRFRRTEALAALGELDEGAADARLVFEESEGRLLTDGMFVELLTGDRDDGLTVRMRLDLLAEAYEGRL